MAKKQAAEKELEATKAELQGVDTRLTENEVKLNMFVLWLKKSV